MAEAALVFGSPESMLERIGANASLPELGFVAFWSNELILAHDDAIASGVTWIEASTAM